MHQGMPGWTRTTLVSLGGSCTGDNKPVATRRMECTYSPAFVTSQRTVG
jgi:hypothetical protein